MTVVRYVGPRRAHVGAIGTAVPGGVDIGGRTIVGTCEPVTWQLWRNGALVADCSGWLDGCSALAVGSGVPVVADPSVTGVEVIAGDDVWRLVPV